MLTSLRNLQDHTQELPTNERIENVFICSKGYFMRKTFGELIEETREQCAQNAWNRARRASRLRHLLNQQGESFHGRVLSRVKIQALSRLLEIVGERAKVTRDKKHPYCVLIRFAGRGLHVPRRLWTARN